MPYTISKQFAFCASHTLDSLPEGHKCRRLHGHNYKVEVELRDNALDPDGMVRDYGDLALFRDYLNKYYDHRHLNDVVNFPPTAEAMAYHLYQLAKELFSQTVAVRVSETSETWAEYRE